MPGPFDKDVMPQWRTTDGLLRQIASESNIPTAIGELLKAGGKPEDLMMRGRLADQAILNSWLDYWNRCVRYSEYALDEAIKEAWQKKRQSALMWFAGQVSVGGVGRKQTVQVATGVLHHALYSENARDGGVRQRGKGWKFMGSDSDKEEE